MSRLRSLITVTTLAVLNLNGCVPITAVSTAVVGTAINEERSAGDKLDDSLITLKIKDHSERSKITLAAS